MPLVQFHPGLRGHLGANFSLSSGTTSLNVTMHVEVALAATMLHLIAKLPKLLGLAFHINKNLPR